MVVLKKPSYSWWFNSHNSPRRSPWLLSTLAELDEKTNAMLKLIEEDADSFAQRAEMYYKKRPELVSMVEDFYRAHRSLAEQVNQLKMEGRSRNTTPFGSPRSSRSFSMKIRDSTDGKSSRTSSASLDSEDSEVDDPEEATSEVDNTEINVPIKEYEEIRTDIGRSSATQFSEDVERLKEENRILKAQLAEKDEQKREVIRQLCLSVDILKEENGELKKCIREYKKNALFDFMKSKKTMLSWKLFGGQ